MVSTRRVRKERASMVQGGRAKCFISNVKDGRKSPVGVWREDILSKGNSKCEACGGRTYGVTEEQNSKVATVAGTRCQGDSDKE